MSTLVGHFVSSPREREKRLIVLGFNDTSTLVGHFVPSPREREKRDKRDSRGNEKEEQGRKRNRNESEEKKKLEMCQYDTDTPTQGPSSPVGRHFPKK